MPLDATQIITATGQAKLAEAMFEALEVRITDVALGDGNGARYAPSEAQTALRGERVRQPITSQSQLDASTWRVRAEFGTGIPNFWLREIGFFSAAGDLIFLVAGTDMAEGWTGAFDLLFQHDLNLSGIKDGLVVVSAPDDDYIAHATQSLHMQATLTRQQFHLTEAFRAQHGQYPGV